MSTDEEWLAEIRDAVAAEKDWRRNRVYEETYRWRDATTFLLERLNAIDHVHVVTTRTNWGVTTEVCLFDDEVWPCWHHRQIHPDDSATQQYVEKVQQEMEELSHE